MLSKRNRYQCKRNVVIDDKFYKGGVIYEFSKPPHEKYFILQESKKPKHKKGKKKKESDL